jgi:RNA polymerase sigma-70 factor (ECF subfamily)
MQSEFSTTTVVLNALVRLRQGDEAAREELIEYAQGRLRLIAASMLRSDPQVARWEEADDVLQAALMKLDAALADAPPGDKQYFLRLSTLQIRRTLIDLARRYSGPEGMGKNHETKRNTGDDSSPLASDERVSNNREPQSLNEWTAFHEAVATLPDDERQVFELVWYQGLTQLEAAELLEVSEKTIRRRWTAARLHLGEMIQAPAENARDG